VFSAQSLFTATPVVCKVAVGGGVRSVGKGGGVGSSVGVEGVGVGTGGGGGAQPQRAVDGR